MRPLLTVFALVAGLAVAAPTLAEDSSRDVRLYKNPNCGCCEAYADHLRAEGFDVTVEPTDELAAMGRAAGIADDFQGCHLAFVDGYVVSGHVPLGIVHRLLTERPDILGITLPGMPTGTPGMPGPRVGPLTIYEVGATEPRIYAVD